MIELTAARGVEAIVGDVQELPFEGGEFDCAVAAWMLFHVAEIDRALSELARVLRPGGRLVAVTNGLDHLTELREAIGAPPFEFTFHADNGRDLLHRHFERVRRLDATGWIAFPDRAAAQEYVDSSISWHGRELPAFEGGLRVRRAPYVFVADK
jgi:SAM-dependent methyltransferase